NPGGLRHPGCARLGRPLRLIGISKTCGALAASPERLRSMAFPKSAEPSLRSPAALRSMAFLKPAEPFAGSQSRAPQRVAAVETLETRAVADRDVPAVVAQRSVAGDLRELAVHGGLA